MRHLQEHNIPALIADNQMRSRDERFGPKDFEFNNDNTATCPAGNLMSSSGTIYISSRGLHYQTYAAKEVDCTACPLSKQCLKGPLKPNDGRGRQVTRFVPKPKDPTHPSERMRQAIDSPKGHHLYSQRIGTVELVFANIRHNKRLTRLNHRGREKVKTQWNLYCMVHNIEKLAKTQLGQKPKQIGSVKSPKACAKCKKDRNCGTLLKCKKNSPLLFLCHAHAIASSPKCRFFYSLVT